MNHLHRVAFAMVFAACAASCEKPASDKAIPPAAQSSPTTGKSMGKAEIKVLADGSLYLDGQSSTFDAMERRFAELSKTNGVVWYYRESPQSEPPPQAMKVIELVVKHQLPITMSSKPDFSDVIDEKGVSHPRE